MRAAPVLKSSRVWLKLAEVGDAQALLDYYIQNKDHLAPTDPPKPPGFYTVDFWSQRLKSSFEEFGLGKSARFVLIKPAVEHSIFGTVNFTNIVRGPFQACYLGYSIAAAQEGKGLMSEALKLGIEYAFDQLGLHRIMANHLPQNLRSEKLLKRCGFVVEGYAKEYLMIDGRWQDHVLNSLTNPRWETKALLP